MSSLGKKIEGATIIEVLVALVIAMTILGIGMVLIANIGKNNNANIKYRSKLLLNERKIMIEKNIQIHEDSIHYGRVTIYEKVSSYSGYEDIYLLELKAFSERKNLLVERNLIIKEDN